MGNLRNLSSLKRLGWIGACFAILGLAACKTAVEEPQGSSILSNDSSGTVSDSEGSAQSGPFAGPGSYPLWAYDAGPDPKTPMGRELIDLNSEIPFFPGVSEEIYGDQMFRPAFGPIPWRMMQRPNSIKILFIGQDGTHIAEAANRPATAGFGGRAQDLAQYFGVTSSAAFINTYAFTIRWQYGAFDTPFLWDVNGSPKYGTSSFTGNPVWLITQHRESPIVQWRNKLIDWIIRNNKDSLKMIVLFGGAARDAAGSWVVSKSGEVSPRLCTSTASWCKNKPGSLDDYSKLTIPEFNLVSSVSNRQAAHPYKKNGYDVYWDFKGSRPNYKDENATKKMQSDFAAEFASNPKPWLEKMVVNRGGYKGSNMIEPAQFGGYDIGYGMKINGRKTISLKGLRVSPDVTIGHDILITQLPHPTALSMMDSSAASQAVGKGLKSFKYYVDRGWKIKADPGFDNRFAKGEPYRYARGDMGPEYYDFGAPKSRMVNVSTATRSGRNVIVFGTRDKASFAGRSDKARLKAMQDAKPSDYPDRKEMWTMRPRLPQNRYTFDPGPGEKWAKLMKTSLPSSASFRKARSTNGDFGHYRGTFNKAKVVIFADPHGEDDLSTGRALTGSRGQYLHGIMHDAGIGEDYLVIKTAPYSMPDCSNSLWNDTFKQTGEYREKVFKAVMKAAPNAVVIADGKYAIEAVEDVLPGQRFVKIQRDSNKANAGLSAASSALKSALRASRLNLKMKDIPRAHLPFYSRWWEGTSGDRVITSSADKYCGKAFATVAPSWATSQKFVMSSETKSQIAKMKRIVDDNKVRHGGEKVTKFVERRGL